MGSGLSPLGGVGGFPQMGLMIWLRLTWLISVRSTYLLLLKKRNAENNGLLFWSLATDQTVMTLVKKT